MNIRNAILLLLLSVCLIPIAYGQNITIKGKVTAADLQAGVPGASVVVKGTTIGTATDVEGNYSLQVPTTSKILVFSLIGYETQEVQIGNQTEINITLKVSVGNLNEVVVVGYGTSTTKELTGAVSTLRGASLEKLNPTRIENALQGQVAGVQITSSSGSPTKHSD